MDQQEYLLNISNLIWMNFCFINDLNKAILEAHMSIENSLGCVLNISNQDLDLIKDLLVH